MPNWCRNSIKITSNEKELATLNEHFKKAREHKGTENSWGEAWLGNIVEYLGYDFSKVPCRGSISSYNYQKDNISLSTYTAWSPIMAPIMMLIEKYAPNAEVIYTSEEPGCALYLSNDPEIYGHFGAMVWDDRLYDDERLAETFTKDQLKDWIEELLKVDKGSIGFNQLFKKVQTEYDIIFSEYEYCDIYEL